MEAKRTRSYGELHHELLSKDPIREEYRYIRYLLWKKGIKFYDINDDFVWFIRNSITQLVTLGDPEIIQYVYSQGYQDDMILNTKEEYLKYLATGPVLRKKYRI